MQLIGYKTLAVLTTLHPTDSKVGAHLLFLGHWVSRKHAAATDCRAQTCVATPLTTCSVNCINNQST